jgi:hypothetical protein
MKSREFLSGFGFELEFEHIVILKFLCRVCHSLKSHKNRMVSAAIVHERYQFTHKKHKITKLIYPINY